MENTVMHDDAKNTLAPTLGFYVHLAAYAKVSISLLLLNMFVAPAKPWIIWALFGWGIGLLFHGLRARLTAPWPQWKSRMTEEQLKKLAR